ncbi:unnamed protein product, partial [Pylaiella littoralis]
GKGARGNRRGRRPAPATDIARRQGRYVPPVSAVDYQSDSTFFYPPNRSLFLPVLFPDPILRSINRIRLPPACLTVSDSLALSLPLSPGCKQVLQHIHIHSSYTLPFVRAYFLLAMV